MALANNAFFSGSIQVVAVSIIVCCDNVICTAFVAAGLLINVSLATMMMTTMTKMTKTKTPTTTIKQQHTNIMPSLTSKNNAVI